jgi:N-acetylglucosamine-6-phosphate deacetylase
VSVIRGRVVTPAGVAHDAIVAIRDGRIASVVRAGADGRPSTALPDEPHVVLANDETLAPGLVDIHLHGAGGIDAMDGPTAIRRIGRYLAARGITSFLPTAVSAPLERLAGFAADVRAAREAQADDRAAGAALPEATILGANLEGPALATRHRGAHDPDVLTTPTDVLAAWRADPGRWAEVRVVTLAPELRGGIELVRRLAGDGRVASVGHTGATYEEACAAYEAGARSTTHLFNQMTPLHHRLPGTVAAALTHPTASVELIADGHHVVPAVWPIIWRTVGSRLMLVSDAISAAGTGDRDLRVGGLDVTVRGGRATLRDGTLAGSTVLLDGSLRNVVRGGLSLAKACRAASQRPAWTVGAFEKGRIEVGCDADLVVLGPDGSVRRVMVGGHWLDDAHAADGDAADAG